MKIFCRVLLGLIVMATPTFACAGSASGSSSKTDGYFLGSRNEAYLSTHHSKKFLQDITSVCEKNGPLWANGVNQPLHCSGIQYIEEAGDGPVYALAINGVNNASSLPRVLLFSIKPFPIKNWTFRKIKKQEAENIKSLLKRYDQQYTGALDSIYSAKVIDSSRTGLSLFFLPWKIINDGPTDEVNPYYLAIIGSEKGFTLSGEFSGHMIGFVDLDGDGIPEIQLSRDCDGTCESVISVKDNIEHVIDISNH